MKTKPVQPDSFRLRVLKALTAALEDITPENGYQHNLAGAVFRGRDTFGHRDPLPMVSLLESIDEKEWTRMPEGSGTQGSQWELLVQGWVEDNDKNPTDPAYQLLADVKKRLAEIRKDRYNALGFQGKVEKVNFSSGVVRPSDEISDKAYFWLKVQLFVIEDHLTPFS